MLVVNELEVSIVLLLLFIFKSLFGEHSTHLSQACILEPRHLPKEGKKAKFPHNTMKWGTITISLTRMLCFWVKI